uniref:Uncharacterized protein n=1 Tax=Anguilla anguilla TaxID=7936 RepID=A0A0E9Q9U5_ANGAN
MCIVASSQPVSSFNSIMLGKWRTSLKLNFVILSLLTL